MPLGGFNGLPSDSLAWFRQGRGTKAEVQQNCDRFRDRLNPALWDLGVALERSMRKPADARLEGWDPKVPISPRLLGWYVHVCSRYQLSANYPTHWWVALGREEKRYVPLAQITFGLSSADGGSGFVGFLLDEVQGPNGDRAAFQRGAARDIDRFLRLVRRLPQDLRISWWREARTPVTCTAGELTAQDVREFSQDLRELNFSMELYYPGAQPFFSRRLVDDVGPLVDNLYPFYHLAVRGSLPDHGWYPDDHR